MKLAQEIAARAARRSSRLTLAVPVIVWGHRADHRAFFEETHTVSIAAHGGLLILDSQVKPNQRIVIFNRQTQEELGCRVAHVQEGKEGKRTVGIAFEDPTSNFWQVSFPPTGR